jgi:hypothetical protein
MTTHPRHPQARRPAHSNLRESGCRAWFFPAISAFGGAVPITAQSLGVMLAGAVLGAAARRPRARRVLALGGDRPCTPRGSGPRFALLRRTLGRRVSTRLEGYVP